MKLQNHHPIAVKTLCFFSSAVICFAGSDESEHSNRKATNNDAHNIGPNPIIEVKPEYRVNPKDLRKGEAFMTGRPRLSPPKTGRPLLGPPKQIGAKYYYHGSNTDLISLLKQIKLIIKEPTSFEDLPIEELAININKAMPRESSWKIKVAEDAKDIKVSGKIHNHLALSLSEIMQKNQTFHCLITDGVVELRGGALPKRHALEPLPLVVE